MKAYFAHAALCCSLIRVFALVISTVLSSVEGTVLCRLDITLHG